MNRKIKFRGFIMGQYIGSATSNGHMLTANEVDGLCDGKRVSIADTTFAQIAEFNPNENVRVTDFKGNPFRNKQIILMQFTGLTDKNGKEIYEGDICRVKRPNSYLDFEAAIVEWNDNEAQFQYKVYKYRNVWKWATGRSGAYLVGQRGSTKCEVVGNIYENPELLG